MTEELLKKEFFRAVCEMRKVQNYYDKFYTGGLTKREYEEKVDRLIADIEKYKKIKEKEEIKNLTQNLF